MDGTGLECARGASASRFACVSQAQFAQAAPAVLHIYEINIYTLQPLEPLAARGGGGPLLKRLDERELVVARLAEELPLLAVDAEEPAAPGADRLAVVDLVEAAVERQGGYKHLREGGYKHLVEAAVEALGALAELRVEEVGVVCSEGHAVKGGMQ